jgi:hypothetical protein
MTAQQFEATVEPRSNGGIAICLPFDLDAAWGARDRLRAAAGP